MTIPPPLLIALFSTTLAAGCAAPEVRPKDPRVLVRACERARKRCTPQNWMTCRGDSWQCMRLGLWHQRGFRVERSPSRARQIFKEMCDRFEVSSCQMLCREFKETRRCVDLALMAICGQGTPRPLPGEPVPRNRQILGTFRPHLERACTQGDTVACIVLGIRFDARKSPVARLIGTCKDDHGRCYADACQAGDPMGCAVLCHRGDRARCSQLAVMVLQGHRMRTRRQKRQFSHAAALLQKLCDAGHARGCTVLGTALQMGSSLQRDDSRARRLYERACPRDPVACSSLGTLFADGRGIQRDHARAAAYFRKACTLGYLKGCTALALLLLKGQGAAADHQEALELLNRACSGGHEAACEAIHRLSSP